MSSTKMATASTIFRLQRNFYNPASVPAAAVQHFSIIQQSLISSNMSSSCWSVNTVGVFMVHQLLSRVKVRP